MQKRLEFAKFAVENLTFQSLFTMAGKFIIGDRYIDPRTDMARKLLRRGESPQSVAEITGLSLEDLNKIAQG